MAKLRNEIFVLCHLSPPSPNVIRVFEDQHPYRLQKKIEVAQIKYCIDFGSSEIENCLYACDYDEKCVWKITCERDDQHRIVKFLAPYHRPLSLSVCSDGQLLVVSHSSSTLRIYGSDTRLVRSIHLPPDMENPRRAVETSTGNFIILHEMAQREREGETGLIGRRRVLNWGISELTRDGQMVIRRFIPSDGTQQLSEPTYLSLDSDNRVLVADRKNNRVILLDYDLKWTRILCPTGEVEEPGILGSLRLSYDKEKKQLIVEGGQFYSREGVSVYSLNRK